MPSIAVFGAGSIGCYLGGRLAAAGSRVVLIGRSYQAAHLTSLGLTLSDHEGYRGHLPPAQVAFSTDPGAAAAADLVLITVKAGGTDAAARALEFFLKKTAVVVSFQNGLHNLPLLAQRLREQTVLAGTVPFNVMQPAPGHFHQGSAGDLTVERSPLLTPFLPEFEAAGLPLELVDDIQPVQWARLLLNLNSAINGLSGLPLRRQLEQRPYRLVLAAAQREALALLRQRGQRLARLTPLPAAWLPAMLELPDPLFRLLASRLLAIDPQARSALQEDLDAGRKTEVDWLQGEVLRLAREQHRPAPVNARLLALVHEAEQGGRRDWSGPELLNAVQDAG
ncbi:MAG: 2-dehydropantoate 2-reductase [Pseudomonadota bacterium]